MSFSILFPTNQFTAASKSPQELQLLTLPSSLDLQQTLVHIATKGLPTQYPYLYKHLHQAFKDVITFVCFKAPNEEPENQLLIAEAFRTFLLQKYNQITSVERQLIFETCLQCLNSLQFTANEQLVQIMEIILKNHNDTNKLIRRLQILALQLGKAGQLSISKITASRLVTVLVGLNGSALKNQLFDILKRVLSDNEAQARKIGLSEIFPKLLKNLDLQFIELHFQERIYQAVWDENEQIGVLALEVILKNANKFSFLQQSSRIVKIFVDSLTSKKQKVAITATSFMGEAYQKLQNVILRSEAHCVKFWKSLVELSQSKNQKILNNMVYNLPGILMLAAPFHRVDPLCDLFVELFYNPKVNKHVLAAYFHQMVKFFPSKRSQLKDLVYWMMNQLLEQQGVSQYAIKITSKILSKLNQIKEIFLCEGASAEGRRQKQEKHFQPNFCNFLIKYMDLLIRKKVSVWLYNFFISLQKVSNYFKSDFVEQILIPRLYQTLKMKVYGVQIIVQVLVMLLSREGNPLLTNLYFSKVSAELMKSFRSHQRQIALVFYYFCSYHFSIQTFNEFKLGEKYLSFNNDKNLKIKNFFIRNLPRISYFLLKQQKIEYSIIVNRLKKDNDLQVQLIVNLTQFEDEEALKNQINQKSKILRQSEREKLTQMNFKKQQDQIVRKPGRQLRKDEVVRKRIQSTKLKNKIQIKQAPKRKMTPIITRTTSINNVFRQN